MNRSDVIIIVGYLVYLALTILVIFKYNELHAVIEDKSFYQSYLVSIAISCSAFLFIFGVPVERVGTYLLGTDFPAHVEVHCDGVLLLVFLALNIFVYPLATIMEKIKGLILCCCIMYCVNVFRISSLVLFGQSNDGFTSTLHESIWPALQIIIAVLLFCFWAWQSVSQPLFSKK